MGAKSLLRIKSLTTLIVAGTEKCLTVTVGGFVRVQKPRLVEINELIVDVRILCVKDFNQSLYQSFWIIIVNNQITIRRIQHLHQLRNQICRTPTSQEHAAWLVSFQGTCKFMETTEASPNSYNCITRLHKVQITSHIM